MKAIDWLGNSHLPPAAAAILDALQREGAASAQWDFSPEEWRTALYFCDRHQISLLVLDRLVSRLPNAVRQRLDRDRERHARRLNRLREAQQEIAAGFVARQIDWVTLKGMTDAAEYLPDPAARVQYDLDLFTPAAAAAAEVLNGLGYRATAPPVPGTDHLPPMQRKTDWKWQGDFFDERIPIPVEIHFRLWDEAMEAIAAPGLDAFWERRRGNGLAPVDGFGYKALHLLRHVLRGETRASHAYELAWFLDHRRSDTLFWQEWEATHPPALRRLEAVALALARAWFGGGAHPAVERAIGGLEEEVQRWLLASGTAPIEALFRPNKDELPLHLRLVASAAARRAILWRRLLPARWPRTPHEGGGDWARYVAGRAWFHLRTLWPTVAAMPGRSRR